MAEAAEADATMAYWRSASADEEAVMTAANEARRLAGVVDGALQRRDATGQPVRLLAHSMGGRSATCFAAANPARVAGLVLVDWSPENAPAGSKRVANTVAATPDTFATVADAMRYFGTDPDSPDGADKRARFEAYTRPVAGGFAIKRDPFFPRPVQASARNR